MDEIKEKANKLIRALNEGIQDKNILEELFWYTLVQCQGHSFYTVKNLEFTYTIKGNEMFVDRKNKSITKATAVLAFSKALELQKEGKKVTGPKKLGTFGASYLYPVFIELGIIN